MQRTVRALPRLLALHARAAAAAGAGGSAAGPCSSAAAAAAAAAAQQRLAAAFPCFSAGGVDAAVAGVRARLALAGSVRGGGGKDEDDDADADDAARVVRHVLELLAESMDAFASRQYDLYQLVVNGIC